jgi:hypothetical protein
MLVQITNQLIVAYTVQQAMGWLRYGPPHRASFLPVPAISPIRRRRYTGDGVIRAKGDCSWW